MEHNNRTAPFLWLHQEPVEEVIAEIERIHQCGIRSVCLESRTYEDFCKDQWWKDLAVIFRECKKRDMTVWILDDKHFPSGYGNGVYEEKHKDLRQSVITENHLDVCGPVKDGCALIPHHLWSNDDRILGIYAVKRIPQSEKLENEIIDLSNNIYDDMVYFDLPKGVYRIVFVLNTKAALAPRFAVYSDKMSKESTLAYINEVYQPTYDKFAQYFGNTFLGFFSDEPAMHNLTVREKSWCKDIGQPFEIYPWGETVEEYYKPHMENILKIWFDFTDNSHLAERVRYMDIITNLYSKCYCQTMGDWCREHGISYIGHIIEDNNIHAYTGSGCGHYFRALKGQDMSGIDVVLHQIMPGMTEYSTAGFVSYRHMNNNFFNYVLAKLGSSYAHFDVTKNGDAMCELFGAYGWAEGTKIMKYLADHMLVRGINYFVPHAFSPKKNDTDCPPNFYDSGKNPQYRYFNQIIAYLEKSARLIKKGVHISTCAILYDAELRWLKSDFVPNEDIAKVLYDNQLDYDIIPADILNELEDNSVINGEKYNVLVVPYSEYCPKHIQDALRKVSIPVIYVSEKGEDNTVALNELTNLIQPDIKLKEKCKDLKYLHKKYDNTDMYMFVNENIHNDITADVELSGFNGGKYMVYDSFRNTYNICNSDGNMIKIKLSSYNSCFVFTGELPELTADLEEDLDLVSVETLTPVFNISLDEQNTGNRKFFKTTSKLENITSAKNMPHFSGNIYYDGDIEINKKADRIILDLGYVGETAEVKLNGINCGNAIVYPYTFDITNAAKQGVNHIEIMVSNHNGFKERDKFSKFIMFEPSGLTEPIKIKFMKLDNTVTQIERNS